MYNKLLQQHKQTMSFPWNLWGMQKIYMLKHYMKKKKKEKALEQSELFVLETQINEMQNKWNPKEQVN